MSDVERLEVIKMNLLHRHVNEADIEWLISTVEEQQKDIEHYEKLNGSLRKGLEGMLREIERLKKEIEEQQKEIEMWISGKIIAVSTKSEMDRLREALEFYADDTNHEYELTYDMARVNESKVMEDNGAIAKAALKE